MKLTKELVEAAFKEAVHEYNQKNWPTPKLSIKYVDEDELVKTVVNIDVMKIFNYLLGQEDVPQNYNGFMFVDSSEMHPVSLLITGSCKIRVCFEKARRLFEKMDFSDDEVKQFLMHTFAHEITHLLEDKMVHNFPEVWEAVKDQCYGDEVLAREVFAETFADRLFGNEAYEKVNKALNGNLFNDLQNARPKTGSSFSKEEFNGYISSLQSEDQNDTVMYEGIERIIKLIELINMTSFYVCGGGFETEDEESNYLEDVKRMGYDAEIFSEALKRKENLLYLLQSMCEEFAKLDLSYYRD